MYKWNILKKQNISSYVINVFSIFGIILFGYFLQNIEKGAIKNLIRIEVIYSIIILGILISTYMFLYSLSLNISKYSNIFIFLLSVIISWEFQKEIIELNPLKKIFFPIMNMAYFLIIGYFFIIKNEKNKTLLYESINKIKLFKYNFLRDTLLYLIPFYLYRESTPKIWFLVFFVCCELFRIKNEKIKIDKDKKILFLIIIISSIYLLINMYIHPVSIEGGWMLKKMLLPILLLSSMLLTNINEKIFKNIILICLSVSMIPIAEILLQWINNGFSYDMRYGTTVFPIWSVIPCLYTFILLYYKRNILVPVLLLSIFSLFLTGNRGPSIAYLLSTIFMALFAFKKNWRSTLTYFLFLLITIFLLFNFNEGLKKRLFNTKKDVSAVARIYIMKEGIAQFKENMIFGNGINTFKENIVKRQKIIKNPKTLEDYSKNVAYKQPHSHNNIIEILRSMGIIGFLLYVILQLYIVVNIIKRYIKYKIYMYLFP
ncbi:MAG: O-antigen ligase family protein, partial [Fusobacteriaceae bacterium]|nr:O-antigen ligase family protein [Fusobacteriaceae bacterium]